MVVRVTVTLIFLIHAINCLPAVLLEDSIHKPKRHLLLLPVVYRSPETKLALGAAASYTFKVRKIDSLTRTSSIQPLGLYTFRKQTILGVDGIIYFPDEKYILRLHATYTNYPDKFWGIGNNSSRHRVENFSYTQRYIFPQILRKVYSHFFIGLSLEHQKVARFKYSRGGLIDSAQFLGTKPYAISGLGLILSWDSRNNAFNPTAGGFAEFAVTNFNKSIGSNFPYSNYIVDLRKYFLINQKDVIAFQAYGNFNTGQIPFISLATLGGGTIMRGYYNGRFRGSNLIAGQSEYRLKVYKKFGLVGFVGAGLITQNVGNFFDLDDKKHLLQNENRFKITGGGGLRFALKEKERLNLRIDYGFARHSNGVYITVAEAF